MRTHALALLVCGLCLGCTRPPAEPVATTLGDTITITYPAGATTFRRLNLVRSYGQEQGPDSVTFADISAFGIDPDGGLIVAEVARELRRFRPDGALDRVIARRGRGPGEVEHVTSLARLPDGGLAARDLGNARVNYYRADLSFAHQWLLPPMSGYGTHPLSVLETGQVVVGLSPRMPEDGSDMAWPRATYLHMTAENQTGDTIFVPARYAERCPVKSNIRFRAGWFEDMRYFYSPKVQWALLPSGALVAGCPATPLVDVIGTDGRVTRIVFPWTAEKASSGELAQEEWMIAENQKRTLRGVNAERANFAPTRSAFVAILASMDGRIWVWRAPARVKEKSAPNAPPGTPPDWWAPGRGGIFDVFEADGTYLGSVEQPANVPYAGFPGTIAPIMRGDTLWAVVQNEDEVQTVAAFVVTPSLSAVWRSPGEQGATGAVSSAE